GAATREATRKVGDIPDVRDPRVRAIVLMAPNTAPFTDDALAQVAAPVRALLVHCDFPEGTETRGWGGRARPGRLRSRCDARGDEFRDRRFLRPKAAVGPNTLDKGPPPTPSCGSRDSKAAVGASPEVTRARLRGQEY